jgi:hypothetical protein
MDSFESLLCIEYPLGEFDEWYFEDADWKCVMCFEDLKEYDFDFENRVHIRGFCEEDYFRDKENNFNDFYKYILL